MDEQRTREILRSRPEALVPVWTEILCDAQTPVGVYGRLRSLADTRFLLESVVGGERWARYSFIGLGHRARLRADVQGDRLVVVGEPGPEFAWPAEIPTTADGIDAVRRLLQAHRADPDPDLPRFWGGLVGVWGHDLVRCFERLPVPSDREPPFVPALDLLATDTVVIFDNLTQRVKVVATARAATDGGARSAFDRARTRIERVKAALLAPEVSGLPSLTLHEETTFEAEPAPPWTRQAYMDGVTRAQQHIAAGDAFQIVLSQPFVVPREQVELLDVYRVLRVTNPAPYMYMMELPSATLVGASPEVLVRLDRDSREISVRPIAGTRPRGRTDVEDRALERELLDDPKERAEHVMLMDLGRNDVGRVAEGGTVRMLDQFFIERYSRVMHMVSEVVGRLRPEFDAIDALRATFPAGTLSGAPKVRALQIIDDLEFDHRGWYGGAVGYIGYDGGADFAICIRSVVATPDDALRVRVGAGIVYDSDPAKEDAECRNKAAAVLRAIAMAKRGRSPQ